VVRAALGIAGLAGLITVALLVTRAEAPEPQRGGELSGLCEASAMVEHEGGFLIADNEAEDRLFRFSEELSAHTSVPLPSPVGDIEALAPTQAGLLVVGSHSRNKKGKARPEREVVLNLSTGARSTVDFTACSACVASAELAPKRGGLSIEGAAQWQGSLWLGARSPLVAGRAMLLRTEGRPPEAVTVVQVLSVDLGGLGVRELAVRDGSLWILGGPTGAGGPAAALFALDAPDLQPVRLQAAVPEGAEGMAWTSAGDLIVVTDGDGTPGERCAEPATWTRVHVSR